MSVSGSQQVPADDPLIARNLGGFILREKVGSGGFGDVYLAEQPELNREAIVKILRPEVRDAGGQGDNRNVQRFLREARLASRLDHPYAAHIYKFGAEDDGVFWIAMERVRGASLRAVIEAQGPMSLDRFVPLLEKICEVVHTAHEQGIVHRDLKPDNVMVISRAGRLLPKLLDFGIARASAEPERMDPVVLDTTLQSSTSSVEVHTQRGDVLGSPPYMAPELWVNARDVGPPADQYALAALAYEALTGKLAFTGRRIYDIARAHARSMRAPLDAKFPAELDRVLARALSRKPDDRYGNVLELAQAFRAASGVGSERDLPQIDDEQRTRLLTSAPQPIADAVAAYDASRNPHQGREALRGITRNACWYLGILALASRSRVGSGGAPETERARRLLRDLRRQGLAPAGWAALATQLTEPFARLPDTHPLPELVRLLHGGTAEVFASALEGSLFESLADSSDEAAAQAIARELPIVGSLLRALGEVLEYRMVVQRGDRAESWMGVRGARVAVTLDRSGHPVPEGQVAIVDAQGHPVLVLWPLVQIAEPVPGHPEHMFLLAGPGRQGAAKLVSTPLDFEHHDDALWEWFRDHLFDPSEGGAEPAREASPFRGLASYTGSDAAWFFGRERDAELLINRLRIEAFVAVVGPSGVGKSSFVHAGVAPALERAVVTSRPGHAPLGRLRQALDQAGFEVPGSSDVEHLATHILALAAERHGLLIVIDQFEELFTLGRPASERETFTKLLLAITRTTASPVRVVITLRDDFLIRAEQLPGLGAVLARGLQLLGPLGPEDLRRILVETIQRSGYGFEDKELPARMVAAVEGTPAAVALISFTASRLWELRDRQFRQLPRKAYDAIGGVGGALAQHADEVVEKLPPAEQSLVRKAFRQLVTYEGTRAVLERQELVDMLGRDADRLIERLVEARLLISGDSEQGATIEIIHEVLLAAWPRLAEWRREDAEGSRLHEQLRAAAKQWQDRGQPRGLLWRGDALTEFQLWRKRHPDELASIEAAFGAASVREAMRTRRIRRALVATAIAVTAVFLVVLVRANRAEQQSRQESEDLLRESSFEQGRLLELDGSKLAALPHLLSAYRMGDASEANRLLIEEASRSLRAVEATFEGHQDKLMRLAYSPDGKRIATIGLDRSIRLWDAVTTAPIAVFPYHGRALDVGFSRDGSRFAFSSTEHTLVIDVGAAKVMHDLPLGGRSALSPDGRELIIASPGTLTSFDVGSGAKRNDVPTSQPVMGLAFCERAPCVASWDAGGEVAIRDPATLAARTTLHDDKDVFSGAVAPDGSLVVVGHVGGATSFLYADGRRVVREGHKQHVFNISFSADGTVVGTASHDGTARLWNAATGALRATLTGHRAGVTSIRFASTGDLVATSSADGSARLWSLEGTPLGALDGHTNALMELAFSPDGKRLATASWDHRAIAWNVVAALDVRASVAVKAASEGMSRIAFRADSKRAAVIGPDDTIAVIDPVSNRVICRTAARPADQLLWGTSGAWLAAVAADAHEVAVWNADTCSLTRVLAHPAAVTAFAAGATANQLLTGAEDNALRMWDVADGHVMATRQVPDPPLSVGVDGDRWVASVLGKHAAIVLADPGGTRVFQAGERPITGFERDHGMTLAAGLDQYLWLFDEVTGKGARFEAAGPLFAVRVSSDRRYIVGVGGLSPTVWDGETWLRRGSLDGHSNLTTSGGFLGDHVLVTAGLDGTARVWDVASRHLLLVFRGQAGAADAVISPDRSTVIIQTNETTRIWNPRYSTPTDDLLLHFK